MRDIRDDLQDRVNFLQEQMSTVEAQFAKHVDQIKQEHDSKLKVLKADLDAVTAMIGAEQRRLGNTPAELKTRAQPQGPSPQQQPPQARPRTALADMIGLQRAG
ncbi:MAG TPA: hypothetical protein VMW57_07700 [Methyloceanibacter sp.]|nr:hypothetical protein [Methyloceanibacter sp.]